MTRCGTTVKAVSVLWILMVMHSAYGLQPSSTSPGKFDLAQSCVELGLDQRHRLRLGEVKWSRMYFQSDGPAVLQTQLGDQCVLPAHTILEVRGTQELQVADEHSGNVTCSINKDTILQVHQGLVYVSCAADEDRAKQELYGIMTRTIDTPGASASPILIAVSRHRRSPVNNPDDSHRDTGINREDPVPTRMIANRPNGPQATANITGGNRSPDNRHSNIPRNTRLPQASPVLPESLVTRVAALETSTDSTVSVTTQAPETTTEAQTSQETTQKTSTGETTQMSTGETTQKTSTGETTPKTSTGETTRKISTGETTQKTSTEETKTTENPTVMGKISVEATDTTRESVVYDEVIETTTKPSVLTTASIETTAKESTTKLLPSTEPKKQNDADLHATTESMDSPSVIMELVTTKVTKDRSLNSLTTHQNIPLVTPDSTQTSTFLLKTKEKEDDGNNIFYFIGAGAVVTLLILGIIAIIWMVQCRKPKPKEENNYEEFFISKNLSASQQSLEFNGSYHNAQIMTYSGIEPEEAQSFEMTEMTSQNCTSFPSPTIPKTTGPIMMYSDVDPEVTVVDFTEKIPEVEVTSTGLDKPKCKFDDDIL